jgi:hypothetical protein
MALNSIDRNPNGGRKIKYLNKDFTEFRQNLIEYAKTYFPTTYSDFNEASPGMMFIEMASYIGDVLSYYTDDTLKESLITTAEDRENIIALAEYLGYKPKVTSPAIVKLSVYQTVPVIGAGTTEVRPDDRYYLRIPEGMTVTATTQGQQFRSTEMIDFAAEDDREISIYRTDDDGEPTLYLIKKYVNAISGQLVSITHNFSSSPSQFSKIPLVENNIIDIVDVRDSNGNKWYHVPYLAQEMVFSDYATSDATDKDLAQFKDSVPSVLKTLKTSRRFTTKVNADNTTTIVFGAGNSTSADEQLIPSFKNVGLGLKSSIDNLGASFDPSNFLKTTSYGQAPTGEFTIDYIIGGGVGSNVGVGELVQIDTITFQDDRETFTTEAERRLLQQCKNSIACDNEESGTGGKGADTSDEIKQNALANFGSQNRAVTRKDYQVRALSLPAKYGGIAKAYCAPDGELDNNSPASILTDKDSLEEFVGLVDQLKGSDISQQEIKNRVVKYLGSKKKNVTEKNNPFAINLYVLGYDSDKKLSTLNRAIKENLKTYISEYRMLTDGVNILNGFIINIGVEFEIKVYNGYNKRQVLTRTQIELQNYFNIDKWSFNMPINISEVELLIAGVEGVQSVPKCEITNKCLGNYSQNSYNIEDATKGKMVYPSLDPSVFEVKFPNKDIRGRVV